MTCSALYQGEVRGDPEVIYFEFRRMVFGVYGSCEAGGGLHDYRVRPLLLTCITHAVV